jgi:hypothetical protein
VAAVSDVRPREPRQVTRRSLAPPAVIRVALVDVDEEPAERSHVLVVVAHDVDDGARIAEPEVVEVAGRDLPARDIGPTSQPE